MTAYYNKEKARFEETQGNEGSLYIAAAPRVCLGRQTLSLVANTVTSLTVPDGAVAALLQADGNTVRVTLNATAPTATVGLRVDDGVFLHVDTALTDVRLFASTATSVQICYFNKV